MPNVSLIILIKGPSKSLEPIESVIIPASESTSSALPELSSSIQSVLSSPVTA